MPPSHVPTITIHPQGIEIPRLFGSLEEFRAWCQTDSCPEEGRIDWIEGDLEVDMSPEDANTHGTPKTAIATGLDRLVGERDRGAVFVDSMRVVSPAAGLSVEPDVVAVLFSTVESGRVRRVPKAAKEQGRFVEIEGAPDVVVECVSDSSVGKDHRLRERYFAAGIPESWLVDARGETLQFLVLRRGEGDYEETPADGDGFARSAVLGCDVRLVRLPPRAGLVRHRLESR